MDSILAQTFKNFEVIVVDDCSTDNSAAIVESYVEKFGGRLRLTKTSKNSGGAGFPRNKGIEFSRGEFIFFVDPDDTITPSALEELHALAKNFDADVVHCEKYYEIPDAFYNDTEYLKKIKPRSWPAGENVFVTNPTLLTKNLEERILNFSKRWLDGSVCLQFVRRDFILDNEIKFGDFHTEDMIFTLCEICCANNYLVTPNVIYRYRKRENSATSIRLDVSQALHRYIKSLKCGIKYLDEFLIGHEIFSSRPDLKYVLFDTFANEMFNHLSIVYAQIPAPAFDEILRKEFPNGDNTALTTFIFSAMNIYRLQTIQAQQRIVALENELRRMK